MRKKFCGVNKPHKAHAWSQDDLSDNEHFRCSGTKPLAVHAVVQLRGQKYRVVEIDDGVAVLAQRGVVRLRHLVAHLEYHRVVGIWRQAEGGSR